MKIFYKYKNFQKLNQTINVASFLIKRCFAYIKIISLFTILWIFFSGNKDPLMIACGVMAIIFTFTAGLKLNFISHSSYIIKLSFLKYVFVLVRDITISTIQLIKIIYSDKLDINPGTITMNVSKLNDQEKILFSNLITMTPGTFVIAIDGDNFLIHALNLKDLEFKDNSKIKNLLTKMREKDEGKNNNILIGKQ